MLKVHIDIGIELFRKTDNHPISQCYDDKLFGKMYLDNN